MKEPVFEKGYPSYEAVNRRESYWDYMGRRMREEDAKHREPTVNEMLKVVLDRLEELEKKVDAYLHNQGH